VVQRLKEVDVVVIGVGMVGSILSKELAAAGYKVVGLERGQTRFTVPEFQSPAIHDELRFDIRKALMQDNTREPVTFRNSSSQTALPVRRWESFLADSIEYAASKYEDRWVALLEPTYTRITVGMVRCLHLWGGEDEVVLLSRADAPSGTRWSGGEYVYAPGCEEACVSRSVGARLLRSIREAHFRAIDACGKAHAGNNQRRRAHSPGVLRYLEEVLGRKLPNPSYARGASKGEPSNVKQPAENPALESHPFADELAEELSILADAELSSTEKVALIVARRGQGVFRENVLRVEPRCRVTGVTDADHLRASHIKPWRDCSNGERLSENNGLMLAPHVDHLFDRGYISFTDAGELLVSKFLDPLVLRDWGLTGSVDPKSFSPKQCVYFDFHRNQVFERRGHGKESDHGDE